MNPASTSQEEIRDFAKLMREKLPAWYELGVQGTTLFVDVVREHMSKVDEHARGLSEGGWYVQPVAPFTPCGSGQWGYNSILQTDDHVRPGWVRVSYQLPVIIGPDDTTSDWNPLHHAAQSFHHLFAALKHIDAPAPNGVHQLFVVDASWSRPTNNRDRSVCSLSSLVCLPVMAWIHEHSEIDLSAVEQAMQRCYRQMHRIDSYPHYRCRIRPPKWLFLETFGDACDLCPEDLYDSELDHGYSLVPHNLDNPMQLFSLLAGLAALHQLIRETP